MLPVVYPQSVFRFRSLQSAPDRFWLKRFQFGMANKISARLARVMTIMGWRDHCIQPKLTQFSLVLIETGKPARKKSSRNALFQGIFSAHITQMDDIYDLLHEINNHSHSFSCWFLVASLLWFGTLIHIIRGHQSGALFSRFLDFRQRHRRRRRGRRPGRLILELTKPVAKAKHYFAFIQIHRFKYLPFFSFIAWLAINVVVCFSLLLLQNGSVFYFMSELSMWMRFGNICVHFPLWKR